MERAFISLILILVVGVAFVYPTALISIPFALGIYFVTRADKPVIKKAGLLPAIGYALGWGLLSTAFFTFLTYVTSDFLFGKPLANSPSVHIDALNFGVMLTLVVFLANRISVSPVARRLLIVLQPAFVFIVFYAVTLIFDLYIRGQIDMPQHLTPELLMSLSSWQYVDIVERVISDIRVKSLAPLNYGYEFYTGSSGSSFSLMPLTSLVLMLWGAIGLVIGLVPLRLGSSRLHYKKSDDGSSMKTAIGAFTLNLAGWAFLFFSITMANDTTANIVTTGGPTFWDMFWQMIIALLGLIAMIVSPIIILITPFIWITAFGVSSMRPSSDYLNLRNRYG